MEENNFEGKFIVIEGADGAGTTTQTKKLAEKLDAIRTCEPAGNPVGRKVKEMISGDEFEPESVALTFAADRLIHLEEEIIPNLKQGRIVISDRYYHSSLIYQSVMGAEREWIEEINKKSVKPDLTIILDVSAEIGMERADQRGHDDTVFEELSFQEKVVEGYRQMENRENTVLVNASGSKEQVFKNVLNTVENELD